MKAMFYDHRWIEQEGGGEKCSNYADCSPVTYAKGFKNIFNELPKALGAELRLKLIEKFGQYNYYQYFSGKFIMSPSIQEIIQNTAKEVGITSPIIFSNTEERIHWGEQKVQK